MVLFQLLKEVKQYNIWPTFEKVEQNLHDYPVSESKGHLKTWWYDPSDYLIFVVNHLWGILMFSQQEHEHF